MDESSGRQDFLTFHIDKEGMTVIVCPACGFSKEVNAVEANLVRKKKSVRCKCGHIFKFIVENRNLHRKKVNLPGQCEHVKTRRLDTVSIQDLSLNGIGFKHPSPAGIAVGDRLKVTFRLDNELKSKISVRGEVVWVDNRLIGVRFIEPAHGPTLGFYLQS